MEYNVNEIEARWRQFWEENQTFAASEKTDKPKYYVLDMFPYPSGAGLHVGHPLGYIASDIMARVKKHQGFNVLHPMGFDAFGLPAEQYAIQTGRHPADTTAENINRYIGQLKNIGFAYDWNRQVNTSEPAYYRWTQWIFTRLFNHWYDTEKQTARPINELISLFEKNGNAGYDRMTVTGNVEQKLQHFTAGEWNAFTAKEKSDVLMCYRLAYRDFAWVNWCEALGTVLANDEVKDGVSERGGHPVERRQLAQWFLRITPYAERLLSDLNALDWSESMKEMQRHWIGKSEGARVQFKVFDPTQTLPEGKGLNTRPRWQTANPNLYPYLREFQLKLRKNPTKAEEIVWEWLRKKKLDTHFRRQHIIDRFIVDFVSIRYKLVIEIDGQIHEYTQENDAARTERLNQLGFKVIRFTNDNVFDDEDGSVSNEILTIINRFKEDELKSEYFPSSGGDEGVAIEVFTTRPDTIFGVSFVVVAPESEIVPSLTAAEQKSAVETYVQQAKNRSERERQMDVKTVSGVFTGSFAAHPFTGEPIPIWIADYVLAGYGTGAVMGVPAHDERDFRFATHFNLPILPVVKPAEGDLPEVLDDAFSAKEGLCINSDFLNGLTVQQAIKRAIEELEKREIGTHEITYRLRDANFSRQRYWGEPFPILHRPDGSVETVPENELPLKLPPMDDFKPTGRPESPLAKLSEWVTLPDGTNRETDTMPGFAGSSWYFLRYMDPKNNEAFASQDALNYWQDVDLYIGGTEHAVGHLLYSRFWHKFLYDLGYVPTVEPFKKLVNQGMIQGRSNFVHRVKGENKYVSYGLKEQYATIPLHVDVNFVQNDELDLEAVKAGKLINLSDAGHAEWVTENGKFLCGWEVEKMSKSKWNVVNPDDIIAKYGADTLRMYEMFLGPVEQSKPWNTNGIEGVNRFLKKFWKLFHPNGTFSLSKEAPSKKELKVLHTAIKKVSTDITHFGFNTCVSHYMICCNELTDAGCHKRAVLEPLLILLSPFAPHITEELWHKAGHTNSISTESWPVWNEDFMQEDNFNYPVSFNGKMRFQIELPITMDAKGVEEAVLADERTGKWLEGKQPKKIIVVQKKIVNMVI